MKLTPYQSYLAQEGYLEVSFDRGWEYLSFKRCPLCEHDQALLGTWEMIKGHETVDLICTRCKSIIGIWYNLVPKEKNANDNWRFTPSENTKVFRERFDIKLKIRDVLIGASA